MIEASRSLQRSRPMSSRPFWVTNTRQRSSSNIMKPRTKHDRYGKRALAAVLWALTGMLVAQSSVSSASGSPPSAASSDSAAQDIVESVHAGTTAQQQTHLSHMPKASALTPAPMQAVRQQPPAPQPYLLLLRHPNPGAVGPETATLPTVSNSSREKAQILHVVLGRSVFIDTPDRLRRIYISNPAVIDSMTPTPHQLGCYGEGRWHQQSGSVE